eukprot:4574290-Amphidinium_carterae.2
MCIRDRSSSPPLYSAVGGMARFADMSCSGLSMGSAVGRSSQEPKAPVVVHPPIGNVDIDVISMLEPSLVKDSSLEGELSTHSLAGHSKFMQDSIISAAMSDGKSSAVQPRRDWGRGTEVLTAEHFSPPYQLPPKAAHLYRRQVDPIMLVRPQSILFGAHKWSKVARAVERVASYFQII